MGRAGLCVPGQAQHPHTVVEAAKGKDAYDHLAAGYTADQAVPVGDEQPAADAVDGTQERAADGREKRNTSSVANCADWLRDELGRGALSGLFLREGALVHTPRIGESGYLPPTEHEGERGIYPGPAQIRHIEIAHVKALVERVYDCGRNEESETQNAAGEAVKQKKWRSTLFPKSAVDSAVNSAALGYADNLRHLRGVAHTPVLRHDGTILAEPGYDASTGLLFLPEQGLTVPSVPDRPTQEQVRSAVEFILRPVAQFPFVREDHRATWVGLMLTPLLRPLLPPPYQFAVITATNPGSGKTLLAELIGMVHGHVMRGELPRDQEELRKAVTATLRIPQPPSPCSTT